MSYESDQKKDDPSPCLGFLLLPLALAGIAFWALIFWSLGVL